MTQSQALRATTRGPPRITRLTAHGNPTFYRFFAFVPGLKILDYFDTQGKYFLRRSCFRLSV